jgi:8-oxo-dGTP pyrophosphatase MutT (NUDIX family)
MPVGRTTARVLPVAEDGSVLLLLEQDPARAGELYWGTIGGAVDPGEDHVSAAVRELHEETGIVVAPEALGDPFHRRRTEYSWNGVDYAGEATCFAVRLPRDTPVSFDLLESEEVGNVLEARWLTADEVAADGRLVWPDLPAVIGDAVAAVAGR